MHNGTAVESLAIVICTTKKADWSSFKFKKTKKNSNVWKALVVFYPNKTSISIF